MPWLNSSTHSQLIIAQDTHAGARGKNNEDSSDVFETLAPAGNGTPQPQPMTIAVVADGVTSRAGGAQASNIAVKTVRNLLKKGLAPGPRLKQLEEAVNRANREIYTTAQGNTNHESMSTTLVLAALENHQLYVVHVGDSRAYLIRGNAVYQLTLDHTWVQKAIDEGRLTLADAKVHPNRHVIVRYLGIDQRITVDPGIIIPDTTLPNGQRQLGDMLSLQPGDAILLCTDGLTDQIKDSEIGAAVRAHWLQPKAAIKQLIDLALERQEPDNITIVLIELPDRSPFLAAMMRKATPLRIGLLVLLIGVFAFGGSLMSTLVVPSQATPSAVAVANTVAQAITITAPLATATLAAVGNSTITQTTVATATATLTTSAPSIPLATSTLGRTTDPNRTALPTLPPLIAKATVLATPVLATQSAPIRPTVPLSPTATLAPAPTATATSTATPTPAIAIELARPQSESSTGGTTEFQWTIRNASSNALYRLLIWPVDQPNAPVEIGRGNVNETSTTINLNSVPGGTPLLDGKRYNWQIRIFTPGRELAVSSVGVFSYLAPTPAPTQAPAPTRDNGGGSNDNGGDDGGEDSPGTG